MILDACQIVDDLILMGFPEEIILIGDPRCSHLVSRYLN